MQPGPNADVPQRPQPCGAETLPEDRRMRNPFIQGSSATEAGSVSAGPGRETYQGSFVDVTAALNSGSERFEILAMPGDRCRERPSSQWGDAVPQ
jgi:hypothetical protein